MRKPLRIIVGVVLILLGFLAAITPFTPGSWLALIGLELLGLRVLLEKKLFSWLKEPTRSRLQRIWPGRAGKDKTCHTNGSQRNEDTDQIDPSA